MASLKELYQKYFGQMKNTKSLFIILLIGIALLMLSGSFGRQGKSEDKKVQTTQRSQAEIAKELEDKLSKTLSVMRGVGSVSVMITYDDDGQNVYALEEKVQETASEERPILKNDAGGGQSPVLIRTTLPKISGVLVIAEGADDTGVKSDIVSAVKAVLDVKPHRVQVFSK